MASLSGSAAAGRLLASICLACVLVATLGPATSQARARNSAEWANATCDLGKLDSCVSILLVLGRRQVQLPRNLTEMGPHCEEEFQAKECVKAHSRKCLAPFERQLAGLLVLGAGHVLAKRCSPEGMLEYLTHYKCIETTMPLLHDNMDQLIYTLMIVSEGAEGADKVPSSCCAFARFMEQTSQIVQAKCEPFDKTAQQYLAIKMVRAYVHDLLDLSCQGYESSGDDKCSKVRLPQAGFEWSKADSRLDKASNGDAANKLPPNKPQSVVLPFLKIFGH